MWINHVLSPEFLSLEVWDYPKAEFSLTTLDVSGIFRRLFSVLVKHSLVRYVFLFYKCLRPPNLFCSIWFFTFLLFALHPSVHCQYISKNWQEVEIKIITEKCNLTFFFLKKHLIIIFVNLYKKLSTENQNISIALNTVHKNWSYYQHKTVLRKIINYWTIIRVVYFRTNIWRRIKLQQTGAQFLSGGFWFLREL